MLGVRNCVGVSADSIREPPKQMSRNAAPKREVVLAGWFPKGARMLAILQWFDQKTDSA